MMPIKAYSAKESFGDMDIAIEYDNLPVNYEKLVEIVFKPEEMVRNGNCLSFEYKEFQIDLIITPSSEYTTSLHYFDYNDLGNLLGRIAHSMGLKLGHDGLSYNWRVDTYQFRNIILLTEWEDILPVLGCSYERYVQGFFLLEDMFEFVVSSPYFNKDIYLLHNRNHTSRVRDAKRKTYTEFLKWLETYQETDAQIAMKEQRPREAGKQQWLPYLFETIEGFEETYKSVQTEWDQTVEFKKRYNGDLVKQWTGIEGKELGIFTKWVKETLDQERFKKDVLALNEILVERLIIYYFDKFNKETQNGNSTKNN